MIVRAAPARFFVDAPPPVQRGVLVILRNPEPCVCEYDVLFRPEPDAKEIVGLDFDAHGARGCHFFLDPHAARAYRERSRRRRVAWNDIPAPTRSALLRYLVED